MLRIRELRRTRKLTQFELGAAAKIHPATLSHIETGRVNPTDEELARIAAVLAVEPIELLEDERAEAAR